MSHGEKMPQTRSLCNARVYYPPMETKQNSSFSDTDIEKEKNTDKSLLCAICPDQVKKKIINYNLTTRNYCRKTPAQYHMSVLAKNFFF